MKVHRDPIHRETHVVVPDSFFEREGVRMGGFAVNGPLPVRVVDQVLDAAYQASPRAFIDHMREKRRQNYLRRFPWLRGEG